MTDTNAREDKKVNALSTDDQDAVGRLFTGDIDIAIARDGTWYHEGGPIRRPRMVALFASILHREADGEYYLKTPVEKRRIRVEDVPFVAVEATIRGEGAGQSVTFRTNVDETVAAGPGHPIRVAIDQVSGEPSPYVHVRDGLEALIVRSFYYQLVNAGRMS